VPSIAVAVSFDGNVEELRRLLAEQAEIPRALELWEIGNRESFDRFLDEVIRLLHNFVTAAISLRNHSFRVKDKVLPRDDADPLHEEYAERARTTFGTPLPQFVHDLRRLCVHWRLPVTHGHAFARRVTPPPRNEFQFESSIVLNTADLRRWDDWTEPSRSFLESAGDEIAVADVASSYAELVAQFHAWFKTAVLEWHSDSLTEFEERAAEVDARWRKAWGEPVDDPGG
jgi:hypothetical protein